MNETELRRLIETNLFEKFLKKSINQHKNALHSNITMI